MADDVVGVREHDPADKYIDNETAANTAAPGGVASRQRVAVVAAGGAAVATETQVGGLTETAPASDTASSGLNGRLQRIAQRLSSLLAVLPGSLGQKARSASLAVTLSSEDLVALTPTGSTTVTGSVEVTNDAGNPLPVSAAALPLPSGAATAANQATEIASLASIDAGIPVALGQTTRVNAMPVALASEDVTALTPPAAITGFATATNQATEIASLAAIDAGTPAALGQTTMAASMPVVIASNQSALPVTLAVDGTATGTLTAAAQSVTMTLPDGSSATGIQLTGTFVGTVIFESSVDNGTTYNPRVYRGAGVLNVLETGTSTFPSEWRGNSAAMTHFRVRCTAYTSGTLTVALSAGIGPGAVFLNAAIPIGGVSTGNAYNSTLATGNSYTGTYERLTHVATINVGVLSTTAATLRVQYSTDGVTLFEEVTIPVVAGTALNRILAPRVEFFRVMVDNASGLTTTLLVEVAYRAAAVQIPLLQLRDDAPMASLAASTKSIVQGVNTAQFQLRTVTTTSGRIDLGNAGRRSIMVRSRNYQNSADALYVGFTTPANSSNGSELKEREYLVFDLGPNQALYGVGTRVAGNPLEVIEIYDV